MKATELMINDLVQVDGVVRIATIRTGAVYDYMNKEYSIGCINPISLTAEILEKNGFEIGHHGTYHLWGFHLGNHYEGSFTPYIDIGYATRNLSYVHELQNALRLCGLNELADNFQIN